MKKRLLTVLLILALLLPMAGTALADSGGTASPAVVEGETFWPGAGEEPAYNGYIVKLRDDVMVTFSAEDDADYLGLGMWATDEETARELEAAGAAAFIQPNYLMYLFSDPQFYDRQWYLQPEWGIDGPYAWQRGVTGSGVTVAVIDSGIIQPGHVDLARGLTSANQPVGSIILDGYNALDGSTDVTDELGHGTMVSGIIGAQGNAIYGVASGVKILPIKVFQGRTTETSYIVKGINYVVEQKQSRRVNVDVLNLSLGGPGKGWEWKPGFGYVDALELAVESAVDAGIIVVAAVGNDGNTTLNYPAAYDCVIGVGALEKAETPAEKNTWASYSNFNESVWITAPGSDILSLHYNNPVMYSTGSGTSFATPCVAGMAALAIQYARNRGQSLTPEEFKELMRLTAQDKGAAGYDHYYGYGSVDIPHMMTGMEPQSITYVLNEGTQGEDPVTRYVPYSGTAVTLPIPTRTGYFFGGWYTGPDFSGERVVSFIPSTLSEPPTYYAKWIENVTDLEAVTLNGYRAERDPVDEKHWVAYLPVGTDFPDESAEVGAVYDYSGTDFALSHSVSYAPGSEGASPTWTITVTESQTAAMEGSGASYTVVYTLTADNTTCHAPVFTDLVFRLMAEGETAGTVEGAVAPISLDERTAAVSFTADVGSWFKDADVGDTLTFAMSGLTLVEPDGTKKEPEELPGLTFNGTTLAYTPSAADEGRRVRLQITASDGRFTSEPVPVELTVGEAPFSQPILLGESGGTFDLYAQAEAHAARKVTFQRYSTALIAVQEGETVLEKGIDYAVPEEWENENEDEEEPETGTEPGTAGLLDITVSTVIFPESFLERLTVGDHAFTLHFGLADPVEPGEEQTYTPAGDPVAYTVTVVDTTPLPPELSAEEGTYDLYEGGEDHRALTVTFSTADTRLDQVLLGEDALTADTDYTLEEDEETHTAQLTLTLEYLADMEEGDSRALTLTFTNGTRTVYTVNGVDTTPRPPALSAEKGTFDLYRSASAHKALTVTFSTARTTLEAVRAGSTALKAGTDYAVTANEAKQEAVLTLNVSYLKSLKKGEHALTLAFANGTSRTYTVTVKDTTPSGGGGGGGGSIGGGGGFSGGGGGSSSAAPKPAGPTVEVKPQTGDTVQVTVTNPPAQGVVAQIPVEKPTAGTVAVAVAPDGTETVIRTSVVSEGMLLTPLKSSATLKIVDRSKTFDDMVDHWAKGNVDFVSSRALFNGMTENTFAPELPMTRGMMATVLFRLDGEAAASTREAFVDVPAGTWYSQGVTWASEKGIVNGYDGRSFAPDRQVSREELAAMVYRYAKSLGLGFEAGWSYQLDFADKDKISPWAYEAMCWLSREKIMNGKPGNVVDPKGPATRAEVAAILERFVKVMMR